MKEPSALHYLCFATRSTHQLLKKLHFFPSVDLPVKATKKKKKKKIRNGGYNAIVHKPLPLRCLKFNGAIFFDDKEDQIPLTTRCHSLSPEGSVRTHSFLCLFSRAACAPAYVEAIPPGQRRDLMSRLRVCTCAPPCVHCALGPPWPILLLFLDNGCIYTLILDYTADLQEGFYKGLAQADSPGATRKRLSPVCLCSVRCHKRL